MKVLVFNGWAAGPEVWALCEFPHDWVFDYVEQLDGLPEKVMEESVEVVLVGFSMGGSTALRMLLKYPEKVKGLVLISTTPCMMEERRDQGSGIRDQVLWRGMSERRLAALHLGTQMMFKDDPSPMYREDNMQRGLDYLRNTDLRDSLMSFRRGRGRRHCSRDERGVSEAGLPAGEGDDGAGERACAAGDGAGAHRRSGF